MQIFYDHIDHTLKRTVDYAAGGRLRKLSAKKAWATIEELARYEDEGWNDLVALRERSLDYENPDIEQLLMGRSESIFGMTSNTLYQIPSEPSRQEEFENLVMNFILDQEEKVKQLEEYMGVIGNDFIQLSLEVVEKLKEEIRMENNKVKKIEKITRYPDTEDLEPVNECKCSETLTKKASFHTPKSVSPKSLYVKHVRTIFPSPLLVRESTFGFKPGTRNNQNIKSRHDAGIPDLQITPKVLPSFEVYTPPMTHPEEVEETLGTPMEVEPLEETQLEDLGLNTHASLGNERGPEPPIKPPNSDSFRMKEVDHLTIYTLPLPHVASFHLKDTYCYYHSCIDDPKKHYGFKPGLLGQSGSLGVDFSNMEMIENDWELEFKEVSFLERGLNSPIRPKEVEKIRIKEIHHLKHMIQQPILQHMAPSHNNGVYRHYHPHLNSSVGEPSLLSVK
ncbi:hypothetical protein Tco_1505194 [Tanacetum coccineum]